MLRDSTTYAHFWGTLTCPLLDYGGCQLVVTRLRENRPGPAFAPDPVEGWEGTIDSFPPGSQIDDYFLLAGDFGVGYGIDATHFGASYRGFSHDFGSQDHFHRRAVVDKGESVWQRVEITVENPDAPNDTWSWDATTLEFPNQHEMDRIVEVKFQPLPHGQGGPSWVQFPDGEILVVHNGAMAEDAPKPFLMGCYLKLSDFRSPNSTGPGKS